MSKCIGVALPYLKVLSEPLPKRLYDAIVDGSPSCLVKALTEIAYNIS